MSSSQPRELTEIIAEVRKFAEDATEAERLPGIGNGPGDAFRHLVGAAELVRRIGFVPAASLLEANETQSWLRQAANNSGRTGGLGADERTMDRINNPIGARIGLRAQTPSDVLEAAWSEILRAYQGGPGVNGAATWLMPRFWREGDRPGENWPPRDRPNFMDEAAIADYPGHIATPRYPAEQDGTPIWVRSHRREGHPVRGHVRPSLD